MALERTVRGSAVPGRSACRCVVLNEKLLEVMGDDVTQEQAFAHANDVLKNAVGGISDISDIIRIPCAASQQQGSRQKLAVSGCWHANRTSESHVTAPRRQPLPAVWAKRSDTRPSTP